MIANQFTVRAVPTKLDKALRRKATKEGKSINTVILESLEHGLGMADEKPLHHDLDAFFGRWQKDEKFDKAIKDFDRIDEELWR